MEKIYPLIENRRSAPLRGYFNLVLAFILFAILNPQELSAINLKGEAPLQGTSVTGKVTDEGGSPLPGVNIIERGTTNGTVTDADGLYNLTVSSGEAVLVYSFVGTVTQQVAVGNRNQIDIQLASDAATLSEVVVVGYGTQEKRDVTGSVATVKSDEFNRGIINSP